MSDTTPSAGWISEPGPLTRAGWTRFLIILGAGMMLLGLVLPILDTGDENAAHGGLITPLAIILDTLEDDVLIFGTSASSSESVLLKGIGVIGLFGFPFVAGGLLLLAALYHRNQSRPVFVSLIVLWVLTALHSLMTLLSLILPMIRWGTEGWPVGSTIWLVLLIESVLSILVVAFLFSRFKRYGTRRWFRALPALAIADLLLPWFIGMGFLAATAKPEGSFVLGAWLAAAGALSVVFGLVLDLLKKAPPEMESEAHG